MSFEIRSPSPQASSHSSVRISAGCGILFFPCGKCVGRCGVAPSLLSHKSVKMSSETHANVCVPAPEVSAGKMHG